MSTFADVRVRSATSPLGSARGLLRWVSTNNPFYVLSAGLFLAGLWISFGAQSEEIQTWALMSGLAGYTLLLAVTACLLVRFGNVWDDVRTVLLLVVLMFLATSVTFDEVLVFNPLRGFFCYLIGLLFAIGVSEGLLRGIRLELPAWFRVPYYLILSLFFLYPLALRPLLADPHGETLLWGLFAFAPIAGLLFLTLLPAIRRGSDYVLDNGSPWRWPLYPWVLFGVLALAVPARAFLLCWSMQLLESADLEHVVFGPVFAAPFGLTLAILILEIGIVSQARVVQRIALAMPFGLLALIVLGHRDDPIYRHFLTVFAARVGEPLSVMLSASALFLAYAALRRTSWSIEALTAVLVLGAVIGPDTLEERELVAPQALPLLAAGLLQVVVGAIGRVSWRCLLGMGLLITAVLALREDVGETLPVTAIVFHLAIVASLMIGGLFDDTLARLLRVAGSVLSVCACVVVMLNVPNSASLAVLIYPLVMAAILAVYGRLLRQHTCIAAAGLILAGWMGVAGWRGYRWLRQVVLGLDHLLLSLALFAVAVLVSLAKSGARPRWFAARKRTFTVLQGITAPVHASLSAEAVQPERNEVQEER